MFGSPQLSYQPRAAIPYTPHADVKLVTVFFKTLRSKVMSCPVLTTLCYFVRSAGGARLGVRRARGGLVVAWGDPVRDARGVPPVRVQQRISDVRQGTGKAGGGRANI